MFQTKVSEKNLKNLFNNLFSKIVSFMRKDGKILYRAGQATDDNIVHAHCMLDI